MSVNTAIESPAESEVNMNALRAAVAPAVGRRPVADAAGNLT